MVTKVRVLFDGTVNDCLKATNESSACLKPAVTRNYTELFSTIRGDN